MSQSLANTKSQYSQTEKEALATSGDFTFSFLILQ